MARHSYLTREGYEKLKKELHVLKSVERRKVAEAISEARQKGDLSENAEYDAAKDAQGFLELKISELEKLLSNARIINKEDLDESEIRVLSRVRLKNLNIGKEMEYILVSEAEANIAQNKISVTSPIGKGLLGHKVGDISEIITPGGIIKFEILEISID